MKGNHMENNNQALNVFLRKLILAPNGKRDMAVKNALALLDGAPPPDQILLTGAAAARVLSVSVATLWRLRASGAIKPIFLQEGGHPRYRRADLERLAAGGGGVK